MPKRNAENERIKLRYFEYLKQADGKSEQTIRQVEKAILRFEESTGFASFKSFDQKQAIEFKIALRNTDLAPATILSTVRMVKRFFGWLALQSGYKSRIRATDIDYLNLSEKDVRAASAPARKSFPSLQMVEKAVLQMTEETPMQKRNRAMVALTAVTAIRIGALISLKLKHFDPHLKLVPQNPNEVDTKNSKNIDTFLFPLNDFFEAIFLDWVRYLREEQLFADHDPLFPKTAVGHDENNCFMAMGLSREHWASGSQVREIFKAAFVAAGLPKFSPHRFRDMILSEMYRRNLSIPVFKAWSQNLGHEYVQTSLTSYGRLSLEEQGRLIRRPVTLGEDDEILEKIRKLVQK